MRPDFICLIVVLGITAPLIASGAEGDHKHHASAILGVTEKSGKTAWTYGIEYTYRLNEHWGFGGWYEESTGDFDLGSLGVLGNYFVTDRFPLLVGIGAERELFKKTHYLVRIGAQYQFQAGPITIAPAGWIDLVENGHQLYFIGATIGIGF